MCVWKLGPYLRSRLPWQSVKFEAAHLHRTPPILTPLDNASTDILPPEIALAGLVLQYEPLGGRIGRFGSSEGPTAWRCLSVDANELTGVVIGPADRSRQSATPRWRRCSAKPLAWRGSALAFSVGLYCADGT